MFIVLEKVQWEAHSGCSVVSNKKPPSLVYPLSHGWTKQPSGILNVDKLIFLVGQRPFGVSILYMGWDRHYGFQLYQSDPSGNYSGWKATCIGNNSVVSGKLYQWYRLILFVTVPCFHSWVTHDQGDLLMVHCYSNTDCSSGSKVYWLIAQPLILCHSDCGILILHFVPLVGCFWCGSLLCFSPWIFPLCAAAKHLDLQWLNLIWLHLQWLHLIWLHWETLW